jgi:hypothetical protein
MTLYGTPPTSRTRIWTGTKFDWCRFSGTENAKTLGIAGEGEFRNTHARDRVSKKSLPGVGVSCENQGNPCLENRHQSSSERVNQSEGKSVDGRMREK